MAPYVGTGRSVSTRALATSVHVSKNGHNNLGDSTHPIGRTRSMQMVMPLSYEADGTTYLKAPSWDGKRVMRLYESAKTSFETWTGSSARFSSQIAWRMRENDRPNHIHSRAISLSIVFLTLGFILLG